MRRRTTITSKNMMKYQIILQGIHTMGNQGEKYGVKESK